MLGRAWPSLTCSGSFRIEAAHGQEGLFHGCERILSATHHCLQRIPGLLGFFVLQLARFVQLPQLRSRLRFRKIRQNSSTDVLPRNRRLVRIFSDDCAKLCMVGLALPHTRVLVNLREYPNKLLHLFVRAVQ